MRQLASIRRDERGAAVIEMAIALPVLILLIWGIFQVGLLFQANAGMQHALGEAARYATIHPSPSDEQIKERAAAEKFGTGTGTLSELSISNSNNNGVQTKDLTLTYTQPLDFLFFTGPDVTLTRTKKVHVAS